MSFKSRCHITLAFCLALPCMAAATPDAARMRELDRLIQDVCGKEVVLLGEDNHHGGGATLAIKVELVTRLIDECGFGAIFFESQVYDFIALDHAFAANTATPEQLADAVGGLWSTNAEFDPLVARLFRDASAGRVKVFGLDPQVGGATQLDTMRHLASRLTQPLRGASRQACEAEIDRLTNWRYDDTHGYDDATRARLRVCTREIGTAIAAQPASVASAELALMVTSLERYLDISAEGSGARERGMYENLAWQRKRLPPGTRAIVWCATVHAVKAAPVAGGYTPLGAYVHEALGERAAAIGFSALTGAYRGVGAKTATQIGATAPDALETRVFADTSDDLRYVDPSQLDAFGPIAARALSYPESTTTAWTTLLDGVVVLREERPPKRMRAAKPQQSDAASTVPTPDHGSSPR